MTITILILVSISAQVADHRRFPFVAVFGFDAGLTDQLECHLIAPFKLAAISAESQWGRRPTCDRRKVTALQTLYLLRQFVNGNFECDYRNKENAVSMVNTRSRTTLLFFLVPLLLISQSRSNGIKPDSTSLVASGVATSDAMGTIVISSGTSGSTLTQDCWIAGANGAVFECSGSRMETRKYDGKGPTLAQVKQAAYRIPTNQLAPLTYVSLAKSVGVRIPAEEAEMLQAIHDADLKVYDFDKVDNYLYRQALKQGTNYRWVWKPVREQDVKPVAESSGMSAGVGLVRSTVYLHEVPISALLTMKSMLDRIPDAVFLVSDYEVVKPDPFLAVTTAKLLAAGKIWIIDQWDEPGFGSAPIPEGAVIAAVR